MKNIKFEWDERKAESNLQKHDVSFDDASTVFDDDNARVIYDPDHSIGEERFIILGVSCSFRVLIVCHCYRKEEEVIRIISARKATKKEQNNYWRYTK